MLEHIAQPAPADPHGEYAAATTKAALFDLTDFGRILAEGPDAAMFLGNLATNDIKNLPVGRECDAYFCDARARALFQAWIARLNQNTFRITTAPGRGKALFQHLDRYLISEAVELRDVTAETSEYYVVGPDANRAILATLPHVAPPQDVQQIYEWDGDTTTRRDWFGQPGYSLVTQQYENEDCVYWMKLSAAAVPAGMETFHTLRIEAGMPLWGEDIDENRFVMEVGGAERAVSYAKGCYLGQEPIVMARDRAGHAPRSFVQLKFAEGHGIAKGSKLFLGSDEIGQVTSVSQSPRFHATVALGFVRWKHREPGTRVEVETDEGRVPGEVFRV